MRVIPSIDDLSAIWRLLVIRGAIVFTLSVAALPWLVTSIAGLLIIIATAMLVAALFDGAIAGALHSRLTGGWVLLPQALLGALLGGAVVLYPIVPLEAVAILLSVWMVARGVLQLMVARGASSDRVIVLVAVAWLLISLVAPAVLLVHWDEATIVSTIEGLVAYVLLWSASELAIGLHLRNENHRRRAIDPALEG
jgi:uncharacterized membrane protein HdeD (DUF308 family)